MKIHGHVHLSPLTNFKIIVSKNMHSEKSSLTILLSYFPLTLLSKEKYFSECWLLCGLQRGVWIFTCLILTPHRDAGIPCFIALHFITFHRCCVFL